MSITEHSCFCFFRIKRHLEPLAIAANVTQSAFCRLDEVLLTFGALTMEYKDLRDNHGGDQVACNAILGSLEKRWANADQAVFIAAVILNPFFKHTPFTLIPLFQPTNIYNLFLVLWGRFFPGRIAPVALFQNVLDYLRGTGEFATLNQTVTACLKISEQKVVRFLPHVPIANSHCRKNLPIHAWCSIRLRLSITQIKWQCH